VVHIVPHDSSDTVLHRQPTWWSDELSALMTTAARGEKKLRVKKHLLVVLGEPIVTSAPDCAPAWMVKSIN
jgi:hypothetical protein